LPSTTVPEHPLFPIAIGEEFLDGFVYGFAGFAGAFLNPANDFFLLAFGELKIVIRELGPFLCSQRPSIIDL
jgi:hypothetical protein